ncbi:hypothetical protein PU629_06525 [Pullulanibacillus sp. KACC 23026]|uniref:hypothetical protein n=1 Tax=Pullulanibacillus sp. KACC 23026 TaxID=3028315 RepID=UPI0023AEAAF3|nr:hypothetical protein [Pullulanibacillus sp. KACC 23026]WEG14019.1 hypothetical protein PU629_06525 [Pullulanibacillus sp. KACC 23026]
MKTWERDTYKVVEAEYDGDLHQFECIKNDEVFAKITPGSIDDMNAIIEDLDNGADVNGWEDGNGVTITVPEDNETIEESFYNMLDGEIINDDKAHIEFNKHSIDIMLIDEDGYNSYGNTFYSVVEAYQFLRQKGCLGE